MPILLLEWYLGSRFWCLSNAGGSFVFCNWWIERFLLLILECRNLPGGVIVTSGSGYGIFIFLGRMRIDTTKDVCQLLHPLFVRFVLPFCQQKAVTRL